MDQMELASTQKSLKGSIQNEISTIQNAYKTLQAQMIKKQYEFTRISRQLSRSVKPKFGSKKSPLKESSKSLVGLRFEDVDQVPIYLPTQTSGH